MNKSIDFLLDSAINSLRTGFIISDNNGTIRYINHKGKEILNRKNNEVIGTIIFEIIPALRGMFSENDTQFFKSINYENRKLFFNFSPLYSDGSLIGSIYLFNEEKYYEFFLKKLDSYKNLSHDLKAIFDISYDVIYVSDGNGVTLQVSSACEKLWGKKQSELVGKSVYELESMGIFKPSATRIVLEKKETISVVQYTKTGRRLMVVGTPIKDETGKVIRVVNASRDITEVEKLQKELNEMEQKMEGYKQELEHLKHRTIIQNNIIYQSEKMEKIINMLERIKNVDSTVLISGETGVGKEVIANHIHQTSYRADKPFITINCGAIPENLLESELFGYEKGAFTGAVKQKRGLFELAHKGTLFLDEISEMSLRLQVKLLRVIQEQSFVRVGGTKEIKVNFRLIVATNRDLYEETKKGNFRKDLYYRLNVIPIKIPPLRERKEDIIILIQHYLLYFNKKYNLNKTISNNVLLKFQEYHWPGNIRELKNIIERLVILSHKDTVEFSDLELLMDSNEKSFFLPDERKNDSGVDVYKILPLKKCVEESEKQLLQLAKKKFRTTSKIAEILEVNQSTISRKLKKFEIK